MPAATLLCVTSTIPALFIAKFYINLRGLENCSEKFKSNANVSTRLQTYEHKCKKTIKIHFSATLKLFSHSTHNVEDVLWLKMWPHKIYVSLIHGIIQINLIKLPWGTQDLTQTYITLKTQYTRGAPTVVMLQGVRASTVDGCSHDSPCQHQGRCLSTDQVGHKCR